MRAGPEGTKENLLDGVVRLEMSASTLHEQTFAFLLFVLRGYVRVNGLGEVLGSRTLVRIDERNGFEPDVLFVARHRAGIIRERDLAEAPDVAVEIVSRSSRIADRVQKFTGYERAGVREYWLIDPEYRLAEFFRLGAAGAFEQVDVKEGTFFSEVIPGFRLRPDWLFADPLPSEFEVLQALLTEEGPLPQMEGGRSG